MNLKNVQRLMRLSYELGIVSEQMKPGLCDPEIRAVIRTGLTVIGELGEPKPDLVRALTDLAVALGPVSQALANEATDIRNALQEEGFR